MQLIYDVFLLEYPLKEEYVQIMIIYVRFLVRVWSNSVGIVVDCWGEVRRIKYVMFELNLGVLDRIILGL